MTKRQKEDQEALDKLFDVKVARNVERMIDLQNRAYWVAAGNTLKEGRLFTGAVAIEKKVRS